MRNGVPIGLFDNQGDLSKIQVIFLQWLSYYYNLYQSLAMNEDPMFLTKEVLQDELRTDAYVLWKSKKDDKSHVKKGNVIDNSTVPSMVFMKKQK